MIKTTEKNIYTDNLTVQTSLDLFSSSTTTRTASSVHNLQIHYPDYAHRPLNQQHQEHQPTTPTATMQFKNLATTTAIFMAAILPVSVLATHAIGDPCTKAKYQDTTGCSSDGCNIVSSELPEPPCQTHTGFTASLPIYHEHRG